MEPIIIRYGETVVLPIDTGDVNAVTADIFIGKPGQMYVLTQSISLTLGAGVFTLAPADTRLPLDTYYYQINVTDNVGNVEKYPSPEEDDCSDCENEFPEFIVREALDETEVS